MIALATISGIKFGSFLYFMFWAFLGQVAMILVQQRKYFERIKAGSGFSIMVWFKDNFYRLLYSFLVALVLSPIAVLTALKAPEGLTEFACVGAGAIIDKTIESFTNKKK